MTCLPGRVGGPGSDLAREGARVFFPPARERMPAAVVRPRDDDDVAAVMRWASETGIRVSVRSGGHAFDGLSVQDGMVMLDMRGLAAVTPNADGTVAVMPGARIRDVVAALPGGAALPLGACPTVGIGGLVTGGGLGSLSRLVGLACDSVVRARLVLADGTVATCDATENADLHWALRGGGGCAGIVTELVFETLRIERMTSVRMSFGWPSATEAIRRFSALMVHAPERLDLFLIARTTGPDRFVDTASAGPPGAVPGTPFIEVEGHMLAGAEETRATLAPLMELAHPDAVAIEELAYAEAASRERPLAILEDPAPATLRPQRTASDYCVGSLGEPEATAIVAFVEALQHDPELTGGGAIVEAANGAVGRLAADETAYPHRAADLLFEWEVFHGPDVPPTLGERHDELLGELRARLAGALTGGRYVNYADRLDGPVDWWGPNLERLEAICARVDPHGLVHSRLRSGAPS